MSSSNLIHISIAAHQQRLVQLDAGAELRCVRGSVRVRLGHAGLAYTLAAGQAVRLPDAQWVSIATSDASSVAIEASHPQNSRAEKNRQGLSGLWRLLAARLMVRRGPHGA